MLKSNDHLPRLGAKKKNEDACMHIRRHTLKNHTVGFLLFLIKIRYRITMSSLMKYAEGFKDLPLDSP